jgi:hypothetical protein
MIISNTLTSLTLGRLGYLRKPVAAPLAAVVKGAIATEALGKHSECEDDDDIAKDAGSRRRYESTSHMQHPTEDNIPKLQDSLSSREPSVDSSITDYIRAWQDGVRHDV